MSSTIKTPTFGPDLAIYEESISNKVSVLMNDIIRHLMSFLLSQVKTVKPKKRKAPFMIFLHRVKEEMMAKGLDPSKEETLEKADLKWRNMTLRERVPFYLEAG